MEWIIIYKWSLAIVYTVLLALYVRQFIFGSYKLNRVLPYALFITLLFHLHYLVFLTNTMGHIPLSNVFEVMTSYVFIFVLIYFMIELSIQDKSLGVIIILIAWITQITSNIFIDITRSPDEILAHLSFYEWHVFAMILAYAGFTISFISSMMYILLSREIQKKQLGFFFSRLPSLELMDRLSNMAVMIGVSFITIGILIGIHMASQVWGAKWPLDFPDDMLGRPVDYVDVDPYQHWVVLQQNHAWDNRFTPDISRALVLTDDRNPVDVWSEEINFRERKELHHFFGSQGMSW